MQAYNGVTVGEFATLIGKSPYLLIVRAIAPYLEETYADLCDVMQAWTLLSPPASRLPPGSPPKGSVFPRRRRLAALRLFLGRGPSVSLRAAAAIQRLTTALALDSDRRNLSKPPGGDLPAHRHRRCDLPSKPKFEATTQPSLRLLEASLFSIFTDPMFC
jgi:hypothetical protein